MADVTIADVDGTWVNDPAVTLDGGELRRADSAMFAGDGSSLGVIGGVAGHGPNSLAVSVDASDVVTVQPGAVVIPGNAVAGTGPYRAALATATTALLDPRDATNGRIDRVVFRQLDTDVVAAHGAYKARVQVLTGAPSATPSAPALPDMAVHLGLITVPVSGGAAASVDVTGVKYAAALGGRLAVGTVSALPASAAKGQRAVALNTLIEYEWDGSAWVQPMTRMLQAGTISITPAGANLQTSQAVTFPVPFASAPNVTLAANTGISDAASDPYGQIAWAGGVTATGFTASLRRYNTTVTTLTWIAVG
jgi:hypothetical protein